MKKNLGTLLVENGLVSQKVLSEALQRQVIFGGRLGTNLIEMGAVSEESLLKLLSSQHNVPYAENRFFENIPPDVIDSIPKELVEKYRVVPLNKERNRITLAMSDPTALDVVDEVSFQTNKVISPIVASELRITQALENYYGIRREARYIASAPVLRRPEKPETEPIETLERDDLEPLEPEELLEADILPMDPLDVTDINRSFWSVDNRDDVAQTVIEACLRIMDDVFVIILKGDKALGWMSGGKTAPPVDFGIWEMGLKNTSALTSVRENRALDRGEGKWMYASNPWLQDLSTDIPQELIVCPLVLKKHTVAAIIGLSRTRSLDNDEIEFLVRIMKKASVSLEILILKSRVLML
jgi:hypothetical protein